LFEILPEGEQRTFQSEGDFLKTVVVVSVFYKGWSVFSVISTTYLITFKFHSAIFSVFNHGWTIFSMNKTLFIIKSLIKRSCVFVIIQDGWTVFTMTIPVSEINLTAKCAFFFVYLNSRFTFL
jgi:hypothetical protein